MNDQPSEMQFGIHFMLDGYGCDPHILKDKDALLQMLATLPKEMGMHTICEPVVVEVGPKNRKDPGGLSGFVLIAESHISFHTFPNRGFITLDVYTCQDTIDSDGFTRTFKEIFAFSNHESHTLKRGTRYPIADIYS